MSQVMLTMAMSLDGFISGPNDDALVRTLEAHRTLHLRYQVQRQP
jgi:hypothetical protein